MSADDIGFVAPPTDAVLPGVGLGHSPKSDQQAIADAQTALAKANSAVAQDKRNNSPDCVAYDQKLADKAAAELGQATAQARADGLLDITV